MLTSLFQGLSQADLQAGAPDISLTQVTNSINHLLSKHRLQVYQDGAGELVYKEVQQEDAVK